MTRRDAITYLFCFFMLSLYIWEQHDNKNLRRERDSLIQLRDELTANQARWSQLQADQEWTGPLEELPHPWKRVGDYRLVRWKAGVWPMFADLDSDAIFDNKGVPFQFVKRSSFGAVNGGTNILTGEKHYNAVAEIPIGALGEASEDGTITWHMPAAGPAPKE